MTKNTSLPTHNEKSFVHNRNDICHKNVPITQIKEVTSQPFHLKREVRVK